MEAPEAAANAIVVLQAVLPGNPEITFETNMRKRARKFRENRNISGLCYALCCSQVNARRPRITWPTHRNLAIMGALFFIVTLAGCSDSAVTSGVTASKSEVQVQERSVAPEESDPIVSPALSKVEPVLGTVQTTSGLTISSPNGGEKWKAGKAVAVRWTKGAAGGTVKIQLLKSNKHYLWVTKKTKNDGAFVWKVPSSVPAGSAYKIKIESLKSPKIFDKSDKTLTISAASDSLDLSKVTWLHTKVAKWPQTSTLKVTIRGGNICLDHADKSSWPSISILHTSGTRKVRVNANPWVFVKRGGKWYGGTWEWMATGSVCKSKKAVAGDHIKKSPLERWRPKSGETLYFMVSALARGGKKNNFAARTNTVKVVWP